jgi:toxin ParE1/3/4
MRRIVRTAEAEQDLIGTWFYIAQDNPAAADDTLRRIDAKFSMLAENPKIGKALPDLRKDMRRWPSGRYLILYREIPDGIEIVRVVHGARDLNRVMRG